MKIKKNYPIPKLIQKLVLGKRESFRNSSILSGLILEMWGRLRSANYGALAQPKIQFLNKFRYTFKEAAASFAERYPAFWLSLFVLCGIAGAFTPVYFLGGAFLFLIHRKTSSLALLFAAAIYALILLPKVSFETPLHGDAIFRIKQIKRHAAPFQPLLVYEGTLLGFKSGNRTIHHLPCKIYMPHHKNRPKGNRDYFLSAINLAEISPGHFILKNTKQTTWTPTKKRKNGVEWRFQTKEKIRRWVKKNYQQKMVQQLAISLLTGQTESRLLAFQFGQAGLQHLLVISGFHFALLAFFLSLFLKPWLPRKAVAAILIFLLGSYFYYMGQAPAISRAWIGILLFLGGIFIGRRGSALNILGIAIIAALISDPLIILNAGFQLSFAATAGILFFYTPLEKKLQKIFTKRTFSEVKQLTPLNQLGAVFASYLRKALALNFAVSAFTLPLLLFHFHRFPLISLFYNLFFPLLFSLMMGILVLAIIFPPLHALAALYGSFLLHLIFYAPKRFLFYLRAPDLPQETIFLIFLFLLLLGIYTEMNSKIGFSAAPKQAQLTNLK